MIERSIYSLRFMYKELNLTDDKLQEYHLKALADKVKSKTNDNLEVLKYQIEDSHIKFTTISILSKKIIKTLNYSKYGSYKMINRYIERNGIRHLCYDIYGSKVFNKKDFNGLIKPLDN